jgi:hypothetical protein
MDEDLDIHFGLNYFQRQLFYDLLSPGEGLLPPPIVYVKLMVR